MRLAAWVIAGPWRWAAFQRARWRRGHFYGWRRPRWWPDSLGWPGPRSPHDNKSVVIFAGPARYEFVPAVMGRYTGHVYYGCLRPEAAEVAERMARLGLPSDPAPALAAISAFEGGFDSIQTYDSGKFAWGFIQFTATGGLPRLLHEIKTSTPDLFDQYFRAFGFDIIEGVITLRVDGRQLDGRAVHDRLHDDPALWTPFLRASLLSPVQDAQVKTAYEFYYAHPLTATVTLDQDEVRLGDLFADSAYGRAVVCDRSVNRGVGHTTALFKKAARRSGARVRTDAQAILQCVRDMEAHDGRRLDTLKHVLEGPAGK